MSRAPAQRPPPRVQERWDLMFMDLALSHAKRAARHGDVPVGAVVVDPRDGGVLGVGRNRRELDGDPTAHAEVVALRAAARERGLGWRLEGVTLYATVEPCVMCAGAALAARVGRLVYGCADPKAGAIRSLYAICEDPRLNHRLEVVGGVRAEAAAELLATFFRGLREGPGRG